MNPYFPRHCSGIDYIFSSITKGHQNIPVLIFPLVEIIHEKAGMNELHYVGSVA